MRKLRLFCLAFVWFLVALSFATQASADSNQIYVMRVEGTIVPVVADYIDRGLSSAESQQAAAVIIELDTPGGLLSATQSIVERIMNSEVPVIVYVAPAGGWAASAGAFITVAADVAAMAPGTFIGAAHPVSIGSEEGGDVMEQKVTEATAAMIRSIAEKRERNVELIEQMVRESRALTDEEALAENVIDVRAESIDNLIDQLKATGQLGAQDYTTRELSMNTIERFLLAISEPNIAYVLLSLGTIGLFFELANPGAILPGVVGAICLVLGFYSLHVLQAHWAGIFLILLSLAMFIGEVFITSHGLLTLGGISSLVVGSLILFSGSPPVFEMRVSPWVIAVVASVITGFVVFVIQAVVRTHRRRQPTGREALVGSVAVARTPLDPEGTVFVEGELWSAVLDQGRVEPGEEVVITAVEGLKLKVTRKS